MIKWFLLIVSFSIATELRSEDSLSKKQEATSRIERHIGKAYFDEEKKEPIYTEEHIATFKKGKLERSENYYFDLSGKKIAELTSDYSKSLLMPTYLFRDLRTGSEEGLRWDNGRYFIFRKKAKEEEEVHLLEDVEQVFSCQGWHYYLVTNLEDLQKEPLQMKLIFPSKLDYYSFRARSLEASKGSLLKIRLEFDNWFLRIFTPHLDITYDKETKKIVQYYGASNILDQKGNIQNVYIFYE